MSAFLPQYRMTIYASRSVDPTEVTVLTPAASAPHADPFKVITKQGVAGWQPYLFAGPRGRRGRIDPRTRKTDTGTMSLRLVDKRTGTTNLARWVSGFVGDATGIYNLLGLKCFVEESLDNGTGWSAFYTGRVTDLSLDGHSAMTVQLRDMGEDLEQEIFAGSPHSSIAYANRCPVWPRGLVKPYGTLSVEPYMNATVTAIAGDTSRKVLTFTDDSHYALRLFTALSEANRAEMWQTIVVNDGGTEKWYLFETGAHQWHAAPSNQTTFVGRAAIKSVLLNLIGRTLFNDTRYAVALPVNANVTCYTIPNDKVKLTTDAPLLINDVHPCQLWKDILDGKFSTLNNGAVRRTVGYNAAAFTTLIADATFPPFRDQLGDGTGIKIDISGFPGVAKMNAWIEDNICLPFNLTYYLDELGQVTPVDMRRKTAATITSTLTDADRLEGAAVEWTQVRADAITRVDASYYSEAQAPLDAVDMSGLNQARLSETDSLVVMLDLGTRTIDVGDQGLKVDGRGLRYLLNERMPDGTMREDYVRRWLEILCRDVGGPFSGGGAYITLKCARTANTNVAKPGTFHVVDVDPVPDPSSNRRGGARLGLCIERTEDGPSVTLGFLDLGYSANAAVPTLSTFVKTPADSRHSVDVGYTPNASVEAVETQLAVVAAGGAIPGAASNLWMSVGVFTAPGAQTHSFGHMPVGATVWTRVRTLPNGNTATGASMQQPSAWVNSAFAVVLDTFTTPTGLAITNITQTTADFAWATTDTETPLEILLAVGTIGATPWDDSNIVAILPANTRSYRFKNLNGPTVLHSYGVRHRSPIAGSGPVAGGTFTTTSSPSTAPRPAGLATHN
jgi:hypothetical protein